MQKQRKMGFIEIEGALKAMIEFLLQPLGGGKSRMRGD